MQPMPSRFEFSNRACVQSFGVYRRAFHSRARLTLTLGHFDFNDWRSYVRILRIIEGFIVIGFWYLFLICGYIGNEMYSFGDNGYYFNNLAIHEIFDNYKKVSIY